MAVEGTLVRETIVEGYQAYHLFPSELSLSQEGLVQQAQARDNLIEAGSMLHAITRVRYG